MGMALVARGIYVAPKGGQLHQNFVTIYYRTPSHVLIHTPRATFHRQVEPLPRLQVRQEIHLRKVS